MTVIRRRRFGKVIYSNRVFGRIRRSDNGRAIFFHYAQSGQRHFREGDTVSFLEEHNEQWGTHATDIRAA
jgi:cold shock CspA family protein